MTIFQLIQKRQFRGAEIFAAQLSGHLENLGHEVYLVSLFPGDDNLPFNGNKVLLNRPVAKRFFDLKGWRLLAQLIKEKNPDIIQCNAGDTLKFAVFSKLLFGWKAPIVARNASTVSAYIKKLQVRWLNSLLYSKTDIIISVSELSKLDLNTLFPKTKEKTVVIPVGIDEHHFTEVVWKSNKDALTHIIHVGGFTFEKNHKGLLSIFNEFLKFHPTAHLHLFGDGPKRREIAEMVHEMELQNQVSFYGFVSNPIDYIRKADLLLLPSIIEGLPGVLLEAMWCKTPVVAYNVGGISEIVHDGVTGMMVEKGDDKAFIQKMLQLLHDRESTHTIVANAYNNVTNNYMNYDLAQRFLSIYSRIKTGAT